MLFWRWKTNSYQKNRDKQLQWQKEYYENHKEHVLEKHKAWAKKNMDHTGSVWRLYGRRRRIKNPNIDKEYRLRKKARLMYKPLPSYLTIKTSKVNGLGLFTLENIALGTNMGMSHLKIGDTIFRTPLGGFINHANEANCVKAELRMTNEDIKGNQYNYKKWNLITIQDIKEGEELTVRYTFYNVWPTRKNI